MSYPQPGYGYQETQGDPNQPPAQQAPPPPAGGGPPSQAQGRNKRVYASQQYEFAQGANAALGAPGGGYPQDTAPPPFAAAPGYQPNQPAVAPQWNAEPQYGAPPAYRQPASVGAPVYGQVPTPAPGYGDPVGGITQGMGNMNMQAGMGATPAPGHQVLPSRNMG